MYDATQIEVYYSIIGSRLKNQTETISSNQIGSDNVLFNLRFKKSLVRYGFGPIMSEPINYFFNFKN